VLNSFLLQDNWLSLFLITVKYESDYYMSYSLFQTTKIYNHAKDEPFSNWYYLPFESYPNGKPFKQNFTIYSKDSLYQIGNKGQKQINERIKPCVSNLLYGFQIIKLNFAFSISYFLFISFRLFTQKNIQWFQILLHV